MYKGFLTKKKPFIKPLPIINKSMKKTISIFLLSLIGLTVYSQEYNPQSQLKDYSGSTIVTSQVRGERNKAILRGTEANKNRAFVLDNYNGIQPSIYPGFSGGFWPKKQPKHIKDFKFNTQYLDELVNWGKQNNFHIIHHCLFFPNKYFPNWFWKSNYSKEELNTLLVDYTTAILNANNNKNKIDAFNVINEIFEFGKSGHYRKDGNLKEDCKWMKMGFETDKSGLTGDAKINDTHPIFVRKIFETAAALTNAKLEIRDFNVAFGGGKADGLYQLVKHLKNSNVRIDAVGFQCHLDADKNYNYEALRKNIKRFKDLGVEVYITELDVGLNLWMKGGKKKKVTDVIKSEADWNVFFEKQNKVYYNLIKTAKEAGVTLISDWGFRDDIPYGNWRKDQKAWMLNKDYTKKGAYYAFLKGLYDAKKNN